MQVRSEDSAHNRLRASTSEQRPGLSSSSAQADRAPGAASVSGLPLPAGLVAVRVPELAQEPVMVTLDRIARTALPFLLSSMTFNTILACAVCMH